MFAIALRLSCSDVTAVTSDAHMHIQATEQRQKLLVEVQDLRAQLEGWSDSASMRERLGELRDPALFPPEDPSIQWRAEVTVDTLQEEVR